MKTHVPMFAPLLLLLASSAPAQDGGRAELRAALGDYYAHVVGERLGLTDEQAEALRPRLDDLMIAQQESRSATRDIQARLASAVKGPVADPEAVAALIEEALDTEADGLARLQQARSRVVSALTPRQQATFLLSEEEYREAVMTHLRDLRAARRGSGSEDRTASPWRRERAERAEGTGGDAAPGNRESATRSEVQRTAMRENLTLLLAFQVRNQAGVSLAQVVDLLPRLERTVGVQLDLALLERESRAELQRALDTEAKDGVLESTVRRLLEERSSLGRDLLDARRSIVAELDPGPAAGFLQVQDGFRRNAPQRLRLMQRLLTMDAEAASERGPRRSRRR